MSVSYEWLMNLPKLATSTRGDTQASKVAWPSEWRVAWQTNGVANETDKGSKQSRQGSKQEKK